MLDVEAEPQIEPTVHKITVEEYQKLGELDWFAEHRVELIDGKIIEMAPKKNLHPVVTSLVRDRLASIFGSGWWVRVQDPIRVSGHSEPEPDVAVVPGSAIDYIEAGHPTTAALVVEVSESTLRYDRLKAGLYASAGISDYWIVNLVSKQIEVHRTPIADSSQKFGYRYADVTVVKKSDSIAPLALPGKPIPVADLLP